MLNDVPHADSESSFNDVPHEDSESSFNCTELLRERMVEIMNKHICGVKVKIHAGIDALV